MDSSAKLDARIIPSSRRTDLNVIRLSGRDPSGMLDAISTNRLPGGSEAARTLLLDAKGRIMADLLVVRDGADLLAATNDAGTEAAGSILRRYAPFSKVKLEETDLTVLTIPADSAVPDEAVLVANEGTSHHLFVPRDSLDSVTNALDDAGIPVASEQSAETVRIASGVPSFGQDFTPQNFPGELGAGFLASRVSFEKGCYPGQETVARMHYRGQPNKRLHRFVIEGEAAVGDPILQGGREAGYLTSIAPLQTNGETYALGYLKRRADTEGDLIAGEAVLKVSKPEER